ncbi:TetR/AcrR family transcriptional regulator C-terminal domain-containing protein [Henriciella sp.]|uniref:TetR/AcrR family transcriptional regulator C-terminal domain-containing protein n=1 Tax=Henriciella sp. TaxID=1968823 RepID=UPI002628D350|nr:TetR/AcrR family transcriptional regulator C-terminal domain-containing protein [Henriciella sp.]
MLQTSQQDERIPLNRERIVDAALALLDEVGLDKLSTRRLADQLGIRNASLYWHFRNKDALLDAMTASLYKSAVTEPDVDNPDFDWVEWAAESARSIRRTALAKRDGATIMARPRPIEPEMHRKIERNIFVLEDAGLSRMDAESALQTLRRFAVGSALQEQTSVDDRRGGEARTGDGLFEFGLSLITDSLRRIVPDGAAGRLPES